MTATTYTGFDSPTSIAIRKVINVAQANKLFAQAASAGQFAGWPTGLPNEDYDAEHAAEYARIEADLIDEANQLLEEAGVL